MSLNFSLSAKPNLGRGSSFLRRYWKLLPFLRGIWFDMWKVGQVVGGFLWALKSRTFFRSSLIGLDWRNEEHWEKAKGLFWSLLTLIQFVFTFTRVLNIGRRSNILSIPTYPTTLCHFVAHNSHIHFLNPQHLLTKK